MVAIFYGLSKVVPFRRAFNVERSGYGTFIRSFLMKLLGYSTILRTVRIRLPSVIVHTCRLQYIGTGILHLLARTYSP